MSNATIALAVNRTTVAAALAAARTEAGKHQAWITAINRAALNLEACPWQFDGEILIITRATSAVRYTVTPAGCQCKAGGAGKPCWHRASHRLLVKAAELAAQPAPAPRLSFEELQAAAVELFS